jgi:hypothetical protein
MGRPEKHLIFGLEVLAPMSKNVNREAGRRRLVSAVPVVVVAFFWLFLAVPSSAHVERVCKISYLTRAGWSSEEPKAVDFVTGYEILDHWPQVRGSEFYALMWFSQGEVALVHLPRSSDLIVGTGVEA